MSAVRHADEPARAATRKTQWLAALERELKCRVGWTDEAVSPFAMKRQRAVAQPEIRRETFRPEKTAA